MRSGWTWSRTGSCMLRLSCSGPLKMSRTNCYDRRDDRGYDRRDERGSERNGRDEHDRRGDDRREDRRSAEKEETDRNGKKEGSAEKAPAEKSMKKIEEPAPVAVVANKYAFLQEEDGVGSGEEQED